MEQLIVELELRWMEEDGWCWKCKRSSSIDIVIAAQLTIDEHRLDRLQAHNYTLWHDNTGHG